MDDSFIRYFLKKSNFTYATAEDLRKLIAFSERKSYVKNETVYSPCDTVGYIYIIVKGTVELFSYTPTKLKKNTFAILNRGNIFGYGELSEPRHVLHAVAVVNAELLRIPKESFLSAVMSSRGLMMDFFMSLAHQVSRFQKTFLMENARLKVINYLSWMSAQFGEKDPEGTVIVPRKQTYEQIGNLLFLTRETVVRTFQALEAEGSIAVKRKTITLCTPDLFSDEDLFVRENFIKL